MTVTFPSSKRVRWKRKPVKKKVPKRKADVVPPTEIPIESQAVLDNIQISQDARRKMEIIEALEIIIGRCRRSLENYGIYEPIKTSPSEMARINEILHRPPVFEIQEVRDRKNSRRLMVEQILAFVECSKQRESLMMDVSDNLLANSSLEGVLTDEEILVEANYISSLTGQIENTFEYVGKVTDRLRDIGYRLLREAGFIDDEDDQDKAERERKLKELIQKKVQEQDALFADADLFEQTLNEIRFIMDQSIRWCKTSLQKNVMKATSKQFKCVIKTCDMKQARTSEQADRIASLEGSIARVSDTRDDLRADLKTAQNTIKSRDKTVTKNALIISELEETVAELQEELAELAEEKENLERIMKQSKYKMNVVTTSSHHLAKKSKSRSKSRVHIKASSQNLLKTEVEELKAQLDEEVKKSASLEIELHRKDEQIAEQAAMLEKLKNEEPTSVVIHRKSEHKPPPTDALNEEIDKLKCEVARLMTEMNCKIELIEYQDRRLREYKEDLVVAYTPEPDLPSKPKDDESTPPWKERRPPGVIPDTKKVMKRLTQDFEAEIFRLKGHLENEKHRVDATIRKLEMSHKEQLDSIHKQSLHLLRAINRFKGTVAQILERENQNVAASELNHLPDLETKVENNNTRQLLAQMAGNAVELMVTMEYKLSQALMNKRLEVKENAAAMSVAARDREAQMDAAFKARQTAECLSEKFKDVRLQLKHSEEALKSTRKLSDDRYGALLGRYRRLWGQYTRLQKEIKSLQENFLNVVRNKERTLEAVSATRASMAKLVEEQDTVIKVMQNNMRKTRAQRAAQLELTMADQKHNLQLLEHALQENRISQEMYMMTKDVMKQSMELPAIRLQHLFERYIAYRKLRDAQAQLISQFDNRIPASRQRELDTYVERMNSVLKQKTEQWHDETDGLETKRCSLFQKMTTMFVEMTEETGIMFLPPEAGRSPSPEKVHVSPVQKRLGPLTAMRTPSVLVGNKMPIRGERETMWKLPLLPAPVPASAVNTPRLLDMDINQRMRAAQKALQRLHVHREVYQIAQVDGVDYQDYIIKPLSIQVAENLPSPDYDMGLDDIPPPPPQRTHTPERLTPSVKIKNM